MVSAVVSGCGFRGGLTLGVLVSGLLFCLEAPKGWGFDFLPVFEASEGTVDDEGSWVVYEVKDIGGGELPQGLTPQSSEDCVIEVWEGFWLCFFVGSWGVEDIDTFVDLTDGLVG